MQFEDQELVAEFVVESNEHLADIENELLAIEEGGGADDGELVNKVFRGVHSIKGAAGFLGLDVIKQLAHSLENVLNKIRSNELVATSSTTDVMLKAGDTLRTLINNAAESNSADVTEQIEALNQVLAGGEATTQDTPAEATETTTEPEETPSDVAEPAPAVASTPKEAPAKTPEKQAGAQQPVVESSIRVPVGVLDQLMNLAGELVLNRNHMLQALASEERQGLESAAAELDQVTSNLQEAIMQTRMQPIGNVFGKFPRIVRDLSSKLGKDCKLEVEGKDVEVDKTIIEAIGDPLTHLIRNSVDHGVEKPDTRIQNGKEGAGTVYLRAFHKAGKVCIEIQDDGAGIDPNTLKTKAVEKGVITADRAEQISDRDAVRLIFHPGFSTADKLSDVSGRGVGMDVVRTNIERLGGNVDVESEVGVGTNIRVTLPLTLAIIPSMIINCHEERFAVPQANVVELVRLRLEEVESRIGRVKSAEVLRLRGNLLPLVRLDSSLAISKDEESQAAPTNIIVVETGQLRYGLIVDGIHDSEEIVVKPLGRHLKECTFLAGATILGDGRVALILDAAGIASKVGVHNSHDSDQDNDGADQGPKEESDAHTLLLFSTSSQDQFAVPMEVVSRIERVRTNQIDSVGGCRLLQYRGSTLPLIGVEDHLEVEPPSETNRVYIIVFTIGQREVGLVAPHLDDIREIAGPIDSETFKVPGVLGSLVVDDRATRLLDVFGLAEASRPQWFEENPHKEDDDQSQTRILLAEDSGFFRRQVSEFLRGEGFEVIEFEDGQAAWDALSQGQLEVDLVVSDIEMPRMNGFELCRRIKSDDRMAALPVIALTSLSSAQDVDHGKSVGFDEYQVKMHKDNLVRAVRRLAQQQEAAYTSAS